MFRSKVMRVVVAVGVLMVAPVAAYAIDRFTDVPTSNVFHDDIGWLADAGVTLGCNPPDNDQFCPSDNVTREQMAAFMRRLAENQVVDAATVEGLGSGDIVRTETTFMESGETVTSGTAMTVTIEAPAPGFLLINSSIPVFGNATDDVSFTCLATIDGTDLDRGQGFGQYPAPQIQDTCTVTTNAAVDAGSHTVTIDVSGSDAFFQSGALNVLYVGIGADGEPVDLSAN